MSGEWQFTDFYDLDTKFVNRYDKDRDNPLPGEVVPVPKQKSTEEFLKEIGVMECGCMQDQICSKHRTIIHDVLATDDLKPPKLKPPKEVRITDETTGGQKGMKDCQVGALDPMAIWAVGNVAGFGNQKYERYNFAKGYKWSLSYDALQRHLMAFWNGEDEDGESGLLHLAHAAWHCLALLTFYLRRKGTDDRFPQ